MRRDLTQDIATAEAALEGCPKAWATIASYRIKPSPYAYKLRTGRSMDHADLLQELYLKLPNRLGTYNGTSPLHWWVSQQFYSICRDLTRYSCTPHLVTDHLEAEAHVDTPEDILAAHQMLFNPLQKARLNRWFAKDPLPINNWRYLEDATR